ncbi:hypothetical protein HMPREF9080_01423 [Cardiobacterium valvarum F0432]|uniref:Uncharacterized protein n=1 Tax=Cardiobacterium valvarum F0432 TaxID=797473 RepID=G9ZF68_9GAMM|nr:hypothetical protein HMPREF9080_01423 [Cardiobacterium valvarum F0432]
MINLASFNMRFYCIYGFFMPFRIIPSSFLEESYATFPAATPCYWHRRLPEDVKKADARPAF